MKNITKTYSYNLVEINFFSLVIRPKLFLFTKTVKKNLKVILKLYLDSFFFIFVVFTD